MNDHPDVHHDARRFCALIAAEWIRIHPAGKVMLKLAEASGYGQFGAVMAVLYLIENRFMQIKDHGDGYSFKPIVSDEEFGTEIDVMFKPASIWWRQVRKSTRTDDRFASPYQGPKKG